MRLNDVRFDTKNWSNLRESQLQRSWTGPSDVVITLQVADDPLDWDFDFTSLDSGAELYREVAAADDGVLLCITAQVIDSVEVIQALFRYPDHDTRGKHYVGMIWGAFADCHFQIHIDAAEGNTTGARECAVMALEARSAGICSTLVSVDMDAAFGGEPFELEGYDRLFPQHPLTIVRATIKNIVPTIRVSDKFVPFRYDGRT